MLNVTILYAGGLNLFGYYPKLKPTDLVFVKVDGDSPSDMSIEGKYLIDTVVTRVECTPDGVPQYVNTFVYVTRDNNNNVENFIAEKKERMKITKKAIQALSNAVAQARIAMATASQVFDGTFVKAFMSFVSASKTNLLRMFSVSGNMIDFTSQASFLKSLLFQGNTLMNILLNMIFPSSIALLFRDFLINNPSMGNLLSKYITENVPFELQGLVFDVIDSLIGVQDSLNSIAKDNNITTETPMTPTSSGIFDESDSRLEEIFQDFENNTTGLDIPFPIVELTPEQQLYPMDDLKDLVASETIANLTELGYMVGVDTKKFKDILEGKIPIDFDIINQINANAGDKYNYRYWGTYGATDSSLYAWSVLDNTVYTKSAELTAYSRLYNSDASPYMNDKFKLEFEGDKYFITFTDILGETYIAERNEEEDINSDALVQLTEYYITKGYKDRYRTIPCTKLISATKNARLYFACPQSEENLKFYINSKRVLLKSFPIDLGFRTALGAKILYNVYYTETGYNSNSTMLEVRQGV